MKKTVAILIHMTPKQRANLRKKAKELGSEYNGKPSVAGLIRDVADGKMSVIYDVRPHDSETTKKTKTKKIK